MIIVVAPRFLSFITRGFARAITLWPFVVLQTGSLKKDARLLRHEFIHARQQLELGIIGFYIWYLCAYIRWWLKYRSHEEAYRHICFEKEAFRHEGDKGYLHSRRIFAFYQYVGDKDPVDLPTKKT